MDLENKDVEQIIRQLDAGLRDIFEGDNFQKYLQVMAKFHDFSAYNWQLIHEQCPNATKLAGYRQWQTDFNRHVKKGEKAIRILAPKFSKGVGFDGFREVCVYDISQTDGEPLPDIPNVKMIDLNGDFPDYERFFDALRKISPLPIKFVKLNNLYGRCVYGKQIEINTGMSERDNILTIIHELAHAFIHEKSSVSNSRKEVEAESVAYAVCNFFGLDSKDNSFAYIANWTRKQLDIVEWSKRQPIEVLRASLDTITNTTKEIINSILRALGNKPIGINIGDIAEENDKLAVSLYEQGMNFYNGSGVKKDYCKAVDLFLQAADLGNINACYKLGICYEYGYGVETDYEKSYGYFLVAANNGDMYAQNSVGYYLDHGYGVEQNKVEAFYWFMKSAEQGYMFAEFNVGLYYRYAYGNVTRNDKEAVKWFRKAANKGYDAAQYQLGLCYKNGLGVKSIGKSAYKWFSKAADQGHKWAKYELGNCFAKGIGIGRSLTDAFRWYEDAAKDGLAEAQFELAQCYRLSKGTDVNSERSIVNYQKAANAGNEDAKEILAKVYNDECIEEDIYYFLHEAEKYARVRDYKNAVFYYCKAVASDNDVAQLNLGECYYLGNGVDQNLAEAIYYFELSAEQGNGDAKYYLGECYLNGYEEEENLKLARKYFEEAAEYGNEDAQVALWKYIYREEDYRDPVTGLKAIEYLKRIANNNTEAKAFLGHFYEEGIGVNKDLKYAFKCYREAAKLGEESAVNALVKRFCFDSNTGVSNDELLECFEFMAKQGDADAQYECAVFYEKHINNIDKAFYYYYLAVSNGNNKALDALIRYYLFELDEVPWDNNVLEIFEKAAGNGNIRAQLALAKAYYFGQTGSVDYGAAYKWFETAADKNNGEAQYYLGEMYNNGYGVALNKVKAFGLYKVSAQNKFKLSWMALGKMYFYGYGTQIDYVKALDWLQKATCISPEAQYYVGKCYKNGLGVDIDLVKGIEWYEKAACNGFLKAYEELGKCYFLGRGVPQNYYYAVECFQKSGVVSPKIQFYLGSCYVHGYGVDKDIRIGLSWYRKAAEAGYALAQLCLGEHYYLGNGVLVDSFEALKWFRKAAQLKNHRAQYYLAEFYYKGYIVDKDLKTAFDWYVMAANGGDELAIKALLNRFSHTFITGVSRDACLNCFKLLAEKGVAEAQYEAGYLYEHYSADKNKALYWYQVACDNGNKDAMFTMAEYYLEEQKDRRNAVRWFSKAAALGHIKARVQLTKLFYDYYHNVDKAYDNAVLALDAIEMDDGADVGYLNFILGNISYFYKKGENYLEKAMEYYKIAINNNVFEAAYAIGQICLSNTTIIPNALTKAFNIILIGAKNGQVECQRQVADMLILGVGTEKNEKEAVYWLKQAASNGSLDAELKLLKLLTNNRC